MTALEREIIDRVRLLPAEDQRRVLDFLTHLAPEPMLSARELMKLPPEAREYYVQAAIEAAAGEDFEVFEAYSEEAFDD